MEVLKIMETCLYVLDLDRTEQFYHGIMGFPVIGRVEGRHIFFRAGKSVLLCFISEATSRDESLPPHWGKGALHLAFEVSPDQYVRAREELVARGVTITHDQQWKEGVTSFYFEDPDGHVLEIVPEGMWD